MIQTEVSLPEESSSNEETVPCPETISYEAQAPVCPGIEFGVSNPGRPTLPSTIDISDDLEEPSCNK